MNASLGVSIYASIRTGKRVKAFLRTTNGNHRIIDSVAVLVFVIVVNASELKTLQILRMKH